MWGFAKVTLKGLEMMFFLFLHQFLLPVFFQEGTQSRCHLVTKMFQLLIQQDIFSCEAVGSSVACIF